ncbi:MAG: hypothetical protein JWN33_582 [Candidatus Saccharibacteria bacterium]|nr:hypothetical protein [Candidatus Saccharibacteria bacterium]
MNNYEKLLMNLILNAGEKLIDAASLFKTGYSWRNCWFLTVIAEEEVAKLIIIPFANYAGTLKNLLEGKSILYRHPVKHKIFATYGLQNRDYSKIESLKQSYLYVKPQLQTGTELPVVSKEQALIEITHAVKLFDTIAVINMLSSSTLSDEFKSLLRKYHKSIFVPAMRDLLPEIVREMNTHYEGPEPSLMEVLQRYPLLFAEMMTYAIPDQYVEFFKRIEGKSYDRMMEILSEYFRDFPDVKNVLEDLNKQLG